MAKCQHFLYKNNSSSTDSIQLKLPFYSLQTNGTLKTNITMDIKNKLKQSYATITKHYLYQCQ